MLKRSAAMVLTVLVGLARAQEASDPQIGLAASLFATDPEGKVNNAALVWASGTPSDKFELQRASKEDGPFETVYTGTGASFKDYDLPDGTRFYRLIAEQKGAKINSSVVSITPAKMPAGLKQYNNALRNEEGLRGKALKVGDTYYQFRFVREGAGLKELLMRTSTDGVNFKDAGPVMDQTSHPDLADCKFEAESYFYDSVNDRIYLYCHWELSKGYGSGKVLIASAKPGEKFTVHQIYNPLGVEVRDMSVFMDAGHQAYLVAASNVKGQGANATLYIFKLNDKLEEVTEVVAKVAENAYREAPHIVKKDGYYYLFFSQAAGWYPSLGGYASAKSLKGPWSAIRTIGSPSTFSSQSGGIMEFGLVEPHVPLMMGNRWVRGEGTNNNSVLPIQFGQGFAFYDYPAVILHDANKSTLIPMDHGKLLSQDKPITSSTVGKPGREASKAFDGDYFSSFQSDDKKWPFELTADLGNPSVVRNVQVSWFIHKGSEAFYTYTIQGSLDGKEWTTLLDRSKADDPVLSKTYGFTSDVLDGKTPVRYVKLKVLNAKLHNNPNNWYSPTVYEVKVFGDASR